jgi:hypothetical protein
MTERVDVDILIEYGYITKPPVNNATWFPYGKSGCGQDECSHFHCDHTVMLPTREERMWCPLCTMEGRYSQLKRIYECPQIHQVWHEFECMATGQTESDRKKMEMHGKDHAARISDELGIDHQFERVDYSELRREAENRKPNKKVTSVSKTPGDDMAEAMVSTHDQAVKDGRKQSKGRFTF